MNSYERVFNSVMGKETDRRAVNVLLSLYGSSLINAPLNKYYTDPEIYANGQIAVKEEFDTDILFSPFTLTYFGQAFGSKLKFFENAPPNIAKPVVSSPEMIKELRMPDFENDPSIYYMRETIRILSKKFKNEVPIAGIALSPVDLPVMLMGIENWLEILLFRTELIDEVFTLVVPLFIELANKFFQDGAAFVVLPVAFVNPAIITREICKKITIPVLKEAFARVNGPIVVHAGSADIVPFLDLFNDLPNVPAFVINRNESFSEARTKISPDKALLGNIDGPTLHKLSVNEIKVKCTSVLKNRIGDPRFILSTTAADVSLSTSKEQIHAFINTAHNFDG